MLMPSIFGNDFVDDFFGVPEKYYKTKNYYTNSMMKTDIEETEDGFEVTMDLPGFAKEDIHAELKDGYLTITANASQNTTQKEKKGKFIRKERSVATCSRSFYVGEDMTQEDIKAKLENGVLTLSVPKKEEQPKKEEKQLITIEG